jgi:hypothetical protein
VVVVVVSGSVVSGGVVSGGVVSGAAVSGGAVDSLVEATSAEATVVEVVVGGGVTTGEKADAASRPATLPRPAATPLATLVEVDDVVAAGRVENTAKPAIVSNETPSHAANATRRVLRISPPPPHLSRPSENRDGPATLPAGNRLRQGEAPSIFQRSRVDGTLARDLRSRR